MPPAARVPRLAAGGASLLLALVGALAVPTAVAVAAPVVPSTPGAACTVTWAGAAAGNWRVAANWSPARVPLRTDVVCVAPGAAPLISITANDPGSDQVRAQSLRTGHATFAIGRDQELAVGAVDLSTGALTGRGVLRTNRLLVRAGTTARVTLERVYAVDATVSGTYVLGAGGLLQFDHRATLTDGARITDDGNEGQFVNRVANLGVLTVEGSARIGTAFVQFGRGSVEVPADSTLTLVHLNDLASPGGTLWSPFDVAGTLVLSSTVQVLAGTLHVTSTGRVLDPDGLPALRSVGSVRAGATVVFDQDLVDEVALTVDGTLTVNGHLSAPGVTTTALLTVNGTLTTTTAGGGLRVGYRPGRDPSLVVGRGGRVEGPTRLDARSTSVFVAGDTDAPTLDQLATDRSSTTHVAWGPGAPTTAMHVTGAAGVSGTLVIDRSGPALAVGTVLHVLDADGGIDYRYLAVEVHDPNGQTITVTHRPNAVLATVTG